MSKLGDWYKQLFAEYKLGKKPSDAQEQFNELWASAKIKYIAKDDFV